MIVGGALRSDNEDVYRQFIAAIPEDAPDVAIIPAASGRPAHYAKQFATDLAAHGFNGRVHVLPVALRDDRSTPDVDESTWAKGAFDAALLENLNAVGGIWFVGGDQTRITGTMLTEKGEDSPLMTAVRRRLAEGAVVGGTSAGAAIMSDPMIAGGSSLAALTVPPGNEYAGINAQESGQLVLRKGIGFFDAGIVDQHFDRKGRLGRLVRSLESQAPSRRLGFGVDEDTGILVDLGKKEMTVLGAGNLVLIDARQAKFASGKDQFGAQGMTLSVLSHGDCYNYGTHSLSLNGAPTVKNEAFGYVADQGAGMAIPNSRLDHLLGFSLLDNSETAELRRYAFGEDGAGILYRFTQTGNSEGYWRYGSGTKDQYSARDVLFSIEPVSISIDR